MEARHGRAAAVAARRFHVPDLPHVRKRVLGVLRGRLDAVLGPAGLDRRDLVWTRAGRRWQCVRVQRSRGGA